MKKQILLLLLLAILTGCAIPRLYLNTESRPDEINLKLQYSIDNNDEIKEMLSEEMDAFIKEYNSSNCVFVLNRNDDAQESCLSFDVK